MNSGIRLGLATGLVCGLNAQNETAFIQRNCSGCHNNQGKPGGVTLQGLDMRAVAGKSELLERVLRKVKNGQMPPAGAPRPDAGTTAKFSKWLEGALDTEAAAHPNHGQTGIHRLNRAEYSNAIRDVFDLEALAKFGFAARSVTARSRSRLGK